MTRQNRWDRLDGIMARSTPPLPRRRRSLWDFGGGWGWVWALVGFGLIVAIPLIVVVAGDYYERETVTTEVITKERVCSSDGDRISCKYMIFTEDGTFEITDSIFGTFRFNSSDIYGKIREGHTYKITSFGWRLPWASTYPNIEKIEEVTP